MKAKAKHDLVGRIQIDFLIEHGLQPHHRLLDIGCGWMRAGRFIIPYLDKGNYVGIEKDRNMIEKAQWNVLSQPEIQAKRPHLIEDVVRLEVMEGLGHFDYAIAHSVFTHLTPEQITELLQAVMPQVDTLYASFNRSRETKLGKPHKNRDLELRRVQYPFERLAEIAQEVGCEAEDLGKFGHPAGQEMLKVEVA